MIKRLSLLLLLTLAACGPEPIVPNNPNASPSPSASGTPIVTGTPVPVARVQVQIQIQTTDNQVISGASVVLTSPTQPSVTQTTDASGRTTFTNLRKDAEYAIDVQASGYEGASRRANLGQLATQGQSELLLGIVLNTLKSSLKGRVLDSSGVPLVGATVYDTRQNVTTDAQGRFVLGYATSGDFRLAVSKTGYQPVTRLVTIQADQHQDLGDLTLVRKTGPLLLGIDSSHAPLGQGSALSRYPGLQSVLSGQGFQLQTLSSGLDDQLDSLDTLLILSPSTSFSAAEIGAIQAFVLSGGKLIITGEWAGYAGFDGAAANQLLAPFNLQFGLDTLRESGSGFLNISSFQSHPVTAGISQLKLYQSSSVRLSQAGNGDLLARTSPESFQIASNTGAFAVLVASNYAAGKVIVLGDSSLWSNEDSDGNGVANIDEADNRKLLEQVASW
ncbi:MAG: DUF4350 domain-containing protein [Candidatus Sericytochromatia bacterium]